MIPTRLKASVKALPLPLSVVKMAPLPPCRQATAFALGPGQRHRGDPWILGAARNQIGFLSAGVDAPVYLAFVFSRALYFADFEVARRIYVTHFFFISFPR